MVLLIRPYQDSAPVGGAKPWCRGNGVDSMFFRLMLSVALIGGLLAPMPVRAAIVGDASVPYSATRIVTIDGKTFRGKVFHTPGKQRHDVDINGIPFTFILNIADRSGAVVLPALNAYVDFPLPPLLRELDRRRLENRAAGEERIDGMQATKYRMNYTASDGVRGQGFVWLSRDNILLRLQGRILRPRHRPTIVSMHLQDLEMRPQAENLFIIPKGLKRLPYDALEVLLNLRAPRLKGLQK
jgi:hypothetical protein